MKDIIPVLSKHHHTLTKLHVFIVNQDTSLLFIASFINLQEHVISSYNYNELQHMIFPNLQVFRILYISLFSNSKIFIKFLENNGKNLTDLCINDYIKNNSLNLSIIQYRPNLKNLVITVLKNELDTLKNIQYLIVVNI